MKNYPQLFLPNQIIEVLNKKHFDKPIEPKIPIYPIKNSNTLFKIFFLLSSVLLFFIFPKVSILLCIVALIWIIKNPENEKFEDEIRNYNSERNEYLDQLQDYNFYINNTFEKYINYKKYKCIFKIQSKSGFTRIDIDFKNGVTHNFFKNYLLKYFDSNTINENITITSNYYFSDYNNFLPYVPDFAYINNKTQIKIAIEIDEPYLINTKEPIHYNDNKRNEFFIKKNWIVLRFAENQIVTFPDLCCEYIKEIIYNLENGNLNYNKLDEILIKQAAWNLNDATELANLNYRDSYIYKIHIPNEINDQKKLTKKINSMFGAALIPPTPTKK
jgi:very-short-patch-repair endonuclease